jgi:hypothetical protein
MKRQILVGLFLLTFFCVEIAFAQKTEKEKPNFSGTWVFEKLEGASGLLIADKNSKDLKIFHQLVIEHKEVELKLVEKIRYEVINPKTGKPEILEGETSTTYFIDERGESNTVDKKSVNSITKWKGNTLMINFLDAESKKVTGIIEWKLSNDGKNLICTKKEKNPKNIAPFVNVINPLLNNKTTFVRKS